MVHAVGEPKLGSLSWYLQVVRNLTATYKWCLSGTPPTSCFQDIKGIAALLGVHLGIDEASTAPSDSREFKQLQKVCCMGWSGLGLRLPKVCWHGAMPVRERMHHIDG